VLDYDIVGVLIRLENLLLRVAGVAASRLLVDRQRAQGDVAAAGVDVGSAGLSPATVGGAIAGSLGGGTIDEEKL